MAARRLALAARVPLRSLLLPRGCWRGAEMTGRARRGGVAGFARPGCPVEGRAVSKRRRWIIGRSARSPFFSSARSSVRLELAQRPDRRPGIGASGPAGSDRRSGRGPVPAAQDHRRGRQLGNALGQRWPDGEDRSRRGHGRSPQVGPGRDRAAGSPDHPARSPAPDAPRRAANWQLGEAKKLHRGRRPCHGSIGWRSAMPRSLPRSRQRTERHRRSRAHRRPHGPRPEAERDWRGARRADLEITGAALAQLENGATPYPASLALKLGQSDLRGDLTLDLFKAVPAIRAKLASDRVVTTDFTALAQRQQGVNGTIEKPLASRNVRSRRRCPSRPGGAGGAALDPDQLPVLDAELQYSIAELQGPGWRFAIEQLRRCTTGCQTRLDRPRPAQGKPVVLDVQVGAEGEQGQTPSMPSMPGSRLGQTRIAASGGISQPDQLQGIDVRFELTSPDATELLRALGIGSAVRRHQYRPQARSSATTRCGS